MHFLSLVCVCIDIRGVIGDTSGGECVESVDIFIIRSLIFSLFIRSEFLSPLGLSGNVPFLNNLSILSRTQSCNVVEDRNFCNFCMYCINSARFRSFRLLVTAK